MLKIYIGIDGKPEGPFAFEEIQQMIDKGQLTANSLAWWKGQANWVKLGTLPGLQFDAVSASDEPPFLDKEQAQSVEKQGNTEKESIQKSDAHSDSAANTGDITVPDFDIEPIPFLLAACRLLFTLKSVTFVAVCLVFLLTFFSFTRYGTNDWFMVGYGIILYVLIAPVNGLFMKQFRRESVFLKDIPGIILRNPLGYITLGAITQIPNILLVLLGSTENYTTITISLICSSLFNLFFFYTTNLLIDKRLSVTNAILFSIQAVLLHPFKTILFTFLQGCVVLSGAMLFEFGLFITTIISWSAGVYAYLWVFSRETIHEKFITKN